MAAGITILFVTAKYANFHMTLRNSVDGWGVDILGAYSNGAWQFVLNDQKYASGMEFKFVMNDLAWMDGPNLVLPSAAAGIYSFDEVQVRFTFLIRLDPGPYFAAGGSIVIRNSADGWDK